MLDIFTNFPVLDVLVKFMIASTVLLSLVWFLEKIKLINTPDLSEMAWKAAIAGSFIAVLPITDWIAPSVTIQDQQVASIAEGFVEDRPFRELAPKTELPVFSRELAGVPTTEIILPPESTTETNHKNTINSITPPIEQINQIEAINTETVPFFYELRTQDIAVLSWILLGVIAVFGLLLGYRGAIKNLGSRIRVGSEENANMVLREVCEAADIKHVPYLSKSSDINSPVCLPKREICLPVWAFDTMPKDEFKSLLAHEIGHMLRRDPQMLIFLQLLTRLFFFQPLFLLARKRLTDIAELAADEWAAAHINDSRSVANALYTCATKINETRHIEWGLAMAGNKSILRQRVERLINAENTPFKPSAKSAKIAVAAGVIGLSLGVPSIQFAGAGNLGDEFTPFEPEINNFAENNSQQGNSDKLDVFVKSDTETSVSVTSNTSVAPAVANTDGPSVRFNRSDDSGSLKWHDNDKEISVKWDGPFSLANKGKTISIDENDASLSITTKENGTKRKIRFKSDDGEQKRTYWVNGDKQKFDKTGERWLEKSLNKLYQSGFAARQRVHMLLETEKPKAVIKVIHSLEADYAKRIYIAELLQQAQLKDKEMISLVSAISKMESDYEMRLAYSVLISKQDNIPTKVMPKILDAAKKIESDYELRLLATTIVNNFKFNDKNINSLLSLASNIESDYELRLLLAHTLSSQKVNNRNLEKLIIIASEKISSDYEMRLLLTSALNYGNITQKGLDAILEMAFTTMDSDYEKRLLLGTLIQQKGIKTSDWEKIIEASILIDSDYEKRLILSQIKHQMPNNEKLEEMLDIAIRTIDSDYERELLVGKKADATEWQSMQDEFRAMQDELQKERREIARENRELQRELRELQREMQTRSSLDTKVRAPRATRSPRPSRAAPAPRAPETPYPAQPPKPAPKVKGTVKLTGYAAKNENILNRQMLTYCKKEKGDCLLKIGRDTNKHYDSRQILNNLIVQIVRERAQETGLKWLPTYQLSVSSLPDTKKKRSTNTKVPESLATLTLFGDEGEVLELYKLSTKNPTSIEELSPAQILEVQITELAFRSADRIVTHAAKQQFPQTL